MVHSSAILLLNPAYSEFDYYEHDCNEQPFFLNVSSCDQRNICA